MSSQAQQRLMIASTVTALIVSIGGLVYSAGWQGHKVDSNAARLDRVEQRSDQRFEEIQRSLGRIEGALGIGK